MIEGPFRAPSSPPETPQPTKWMPLSASAACRRRVSANLAFPPSMMMSSGSTNAASSSMTASVGPPALTMIRILRGLASDATKSAADSDGTNTPSPPCSSINAAVLAYDRLCTAVTNPFRAKFRARFDPITAKPVTPISANGVDAAVSLIVDLQFSVAVTKQVAERRGRRRSRMVGTQRAGTRFGSQAQPGDDLGRLLGGRPAQVDLEHILVGAGRFERGDLGVEQSGRHEVVLPRGDSSTDGFPIAGQVHENHALATHPVPISPFERGTGDDPWNSGGGVLGNPVGHPVQPRPAVVVGESHPGPHLGDIGRGVKVVTL